MTSLPALPAPSSAAHPPVPVGDVNGDGMDDVAIQNPAGLVFGRGDLFAELPSVADVHVSSEEAVVTTSKAGDFDRDGRLDLVSANPFRAPITR